MSFSSDVREELAKYPVKRRSEAHAEMAAMVLCSGGFSYRGRDRYGLSFQTENEAVAQRYYSMCKKWFGAESDILAVTTQQLGERTRSMIAPREEFIPEIIRALSLTDENAPFGMRSALEPTMIVRPADSAAFLRGAFLGCGTVGNPEKSYQMEYAVGDELLADQIAGELARHGLDAKRNERKTQRVVYLKDGEKIVSLLGLIGAHKALLEIENIRAMKEVRNDVNRQVNCDDNNLNKVLFAAERQLSMIRQIERQKGLDALPEPLREIAQLRLLYPDVSLTELGLLMDPPLGKSGVNARMRRLEAFAEELL